MAETVIFVANQLHIIITMKRKSPFKETPILYGESALRFERMMEEVENMSEEERRKNWEKLEREYNEICKEIEICI